MSEEPKRKKQKCVDDFELFDYGFDGNMKPTPEMYCCQEFFDQSKLESLFYSGALIESYPNNRKSKVKGEYDHLLQLKARANGNSLIEVSHMKEGKAGTRKSGLSIGTLRDEVVGALCYNTHVHIECKRIEIGILLQFCKRTLKLPTLESLWRGCDITSMCNIACSEMEKFISEVCRGTDPYLLGEQQVGSSRLFSYEFFDGKFLDELEECQKFVRDQNHDGIIQAEYHKRHPNKRNLNHALSRVTKIPEDSYKPSELEMKENREITRIFLEETIDRIIECCKNYFVSKTNSFIRMSGCHFLVSKDTYKSETLNELGTLIKEKFGIDLTLEQSPFDLTLYETLCSDKNSSSLLKWDKSSFMNLKRYCDMKKVFEQHVKKIETPTGFLTITPPTIQRSDETPLEVCDFKTERDIKISFKNVKTLVPSETGLKEASFIDTWLLDPEMEEYVCTGFLPFKLHGHDLSPKNMFNKFLGFPVYKSGIVDISPLQVQVSNFEKIVNDPNQDLLDNRQDAYRLIRNAPDVLKPFFDILLCCVGDDVKSMDVILAFAGDILQNPSYKPGIMPSITGSQGTGKSIVIRALGSVYGQYFMRTSDPENVWGKHATICTEKMLVNLDETSVAGTAEKQSQFKTIISEIEATQNPKFVAITETRQYTRFIATTNDPVPFSMDTLSGDRRHTVFKSSDRLKNDPHVDWDFIARKYTTSEAFKSELSNFLSSYSLPANWKQFRLDTLTKYYDHVAKGNVPIFAQFINYLDENRSSILGDDWSVSNNRLSSILESFLQANHISSIKLTTSKLKKQLRLHYPNDYKDQSKQIDGKTTRGFELDIDGAMTINKDKGWV